ncbi:MAG TPA: RNA 2',3'-cyclic phosphodiesterase [Gaiellaceae bacterium]|nr:RNA 2',3'-cyclic phosphodiesterase [Gaiellaceae bacterium]
MEAGDRLRLFCALRLPDDVLDRLTAWQAEHGLVRAVPRQNLHVTLAFLGSRPARELREIADELAGAARAAAPIVLEPVRYRETRSVGMVVLADGSGAATALADDLGTRLERAGVYRREQRAWLPHVTVSRFRERPRLAPPPPSVGPFSPSDAAVYSSVLRPDGAEYEALESVALGGR